MKVAHQNSAKLPYMVSVCYGAGSLGTAAFVIIPQLLLLYFLTDTLEVPPLWAAVAVFLPKLWEFATDPVLGALSDKTNTRWGRRRPFMFVGAVFFSLTFYLMFTVPVFDDWVPRFLYVLVMYSLCTTAYTVYAIPYMAMPAEMTTDKDERTIVVSSRMVFVTVGVLLAGALAPFMLEHGGNGGDAYVQVGLVFAGLSFVAMMISVIGTSRAPFSSKKHDATPFTAQIKLAFKSASFSRLFAAFVIQLISISVMTVIFPYYGKYLMVEFENAITFFFILMTVFTLGAMPFWVIFSRKVGKKIAFQVSTAIQACAAILLFWAPENHGFYWLAICVFGIGNAGVQLFPYAMLPDLIDIEKHKSGQNREGIYTGIWVAGEKFGLAFGAVLIGVSLSMVGFEESSGGAIEQTPLVLESIRYLISFVPALILLSSLWPLNRCLIDSELSDIQLADGVNV